MFEESDADIMIRMLYYCSDEPRYAAQIQSYCNINRIQLARFSKHCIERKLLKIAPTSDGSLCLEVTERGRQVLYTAQNIMEGLGIKLDTSRSDHIRR